MATRTITRTFERAEECCCEAVACYICGELFGDIDPFNGWTLTVTGGTGAITKWFTDQFISLPFSTSNPYQSDLLAFCLIADVVGSVRLEAICSANAVCVRFSTSATDGEMTFADCETTCEDQCITDCPTDLACSVSTGTIEVVDEPVCDDPSGFISQDFIIHTSCGDLYVTVSN